VPPYNGALRIVGRDDTQRQYQFQDATRAKAALPPAPQEAVGLAGFITDQFILMRRHRDDTASGWSMRLLRALRAFNGVYEQEIIEEIKKFGGSSVYARTIAMKCRGTTSLLRDVYIGAERPWSLQPEPDPQVPDEILQAVDQLIQGEIAQGVQAHLQSVRANQAHYMGTAQAHAFGALSGQTPDQVDATIPSSQSGPSNTGQLMGSGLPAPPPIQPMPDSNQLMERRRLLLEAARDQAKRKASDQAQTAEDKLEELLAEGGFYTALAEFLVDLPLFPYAVIKGPTVRIRTKVRWQGNRPIPIDVPTLTWARVSPFDIYWTPGVNDIADANVIERSRLTRAEINDMLDLPGFIQSEVRAVLDEYGRGGLVDNWDQTDAERAILESRENPRFNQSGMIACLEYQGMAQGRHLLDIGMDPNVILDPLRDYFVDAWLIGRHVIKVQLAPSPRKRHQYYITSFEKVPGTPVGNGLPDLLADIQSVTNATLRALVNNLSIASGPQVTVNDDRLGDGENGEDMYPWKRWHTKSDPFGNNTEPAIAFFNPASNSAELLNVYQAFSQIADEISAIPRTMTGTPPIGGLGRTASGLSMLLQQSTKILQTVCANVDRDVLSGLLEGLLDMVLLIDQSGLLSGEEKVRVLGVQAAIQREAQRARQLEFLQITGNPIDMQIIGLPGRAEVLRQVAKTIGIQGEDIVPDEDQMRQKEQAQQRAQAMAQMQQQGIPGAGAPSGPGTGGGGPPMPGGMPPGIPIPGQAPQRGLPPPPQAAGPTGAPGNQARTVRTAAGPRANVMQGATGGVATGAVG
jgi:hypothetical protein